jgi:hypothetical protein
MKIKSHIQYLKCFGPKVALYGLEGRIRKSINLDTDKFEIKKHNCICKWLKTNFRSFFSSIKDQKPIIAEHNINKNCPIWVFWWQGFEKAPDIVKSCINSIIANNEPERKVIVISSENFQKFVDIPDYIIGKRIFPHMVW